MHGPLLTAARRGQHALPDPTASCTPAAHLSPSRYATAALMRRSGPAASSQSPRMLPRDTALQVISYLPRAHKPQRRSACSRAIEPAETAPTAAPQHGRRARRPTSRANPRSSPAIRRQPGTSPAAFNALACRGDTTQPAARRRHTRPGRCPPHDRLPRFGQDQPKRPKPHPLLASTLTP